MNVQNFSIKKSNTRQNSPLLPASLRGLIVGRSNSGKTILLLNLLLRKDWLDYNNLLIFGNSLHQEEYQILKKEFEKKVGKEHLLGGIHLGRPAYPGEGGLEKPDIYCYFTRNSIVKPGQTGEGGSENPDFRRTS